MRSACASNSSCTHEPRGYSASVAFHSSTTWRRSVSGSTSSSRSGVDGAVSSASTSRSSAVCMKALTRRGSMGAAPCTVRKNPSPMSSIDSPTG